MSEQLKRAIKANQRGFQHVTTGEVKFVLTDEESEKPFWVDVMVIPNLPNEVIDAVLAAPEAENAKKTPESIQVAGDMHRPVRLSEGEMFHIFDRSTCGDDAQRNVVNFAHAIMDACGAKDAGPLVEAARQMKTATDIFELGRGLEAMLAALAKWEGK